LFGAPNNCVDLGGLAPFCKPLVHNLGVLLDCDLKFEKQIYSVVKSCYYHLRLKAKVKSFLSMCDLEKLIFYTHIYKARLLQLICRHKYITDQPAYNRSKRCCCKAFVSHS